MLTDAVASGFDAAVGDELGGCFVTPSCYAHMTHMLMSVANGKMSVCLEVCTLSMIRFVLSDNDRAGTISDPSPSLHWQSPKPSWESRPTVFSRLRHRISQRRLSDALSCCSLVIGDACIRRNHRS